MSRTENFEIWRVWPDKTSYRKFSYKNESTLKGVGDDAAVLDYSKAKALVTTDLLLEGVHFDLVYVPIRHLGYKAAVVNFSDIYAMNGQPKQMTVSLGVSKRFSVEDLEELYAGFKLACDNYGVDLIGGDTSASLTGLTISITCIGEGEEGKNVYRNGSKTKRPYLRIGRFGFGLHGITIDLKERKIVIYNQQRSTT